MSSTRSGQTLFYWEVSFYSAYGLCCAFSSVCVIYLYISLDAYIQARMGIHQSVIFEWCIINSVKLVFVICNIVSIVWNLKTHYKYRNFRIKSPPTNAIIVYFMCLPFLIISSVALMFLYLASLSYLQCSDDIAGTLLGTAELINFISIIILLLDTTGITDTGEKWYLNFSNFLTILLSMILLSSLLVYNVIWMHLPYFFGIYAEYQSAIQPSSLSCVEKTYGNVSVQFLLFSTVQESMAYTNCSVVLMGFTYIPLFVIPLKHNIRAIHNLLTSSIDIPDTQTIDKLTSIDLIGNFSIAAILVTVTLVLKLWDKGGANMALQIMYLVELLLLTGMTLYACSNAQYWVSIRRTGKTHIFDQVIIWLGLVGEQTIMLKFSILGIANAYNRKKLGLIPLNVLISMISLFQGSLQAVLVSLIRHRLVRTSTSQMRFLGLNVFLFLAIMNGIFTLHAIIDPHNFTTDSMGQLMFSKSVMLLFFPISVLYRVYNTVVFFIQAL